MNVPNTSPNGDTAICQIWHGFIEEQRNSGPDTNPCKKNYNFDLEVKGQGHIKDLNVCDILPHGDITICQIQYT